MYADHFRLTAEPFGLTPDPAFLYLSPEHQEALAAVQYGIVQRRGFITLVGEVGTGKTTLLYSVLGHLTDDVQAAYVAYTTQGFEDLLASMLKDLGAQVVGTSKLALIAAFNAHLERTAEQGRTIALVIDEAQNLSDQTFEELRLLSNFESYSRKLVQVVLVGQPELQQRLRQPNLRQLKERVSVRAFINPLPREEMERYIAHRLGLAGGTVERLFEPRALGLIVRRAAGIPRRANILCHNALLFAYGRDERRVTVALAREAIAEMDERRPGWFPRPALRRLEDRPRLARWAAAVAVLGLSVMAIGHLRTDPAPSSAHSGTPEVAARPSAVPAPVAAPAPMADSVPVASDAPSEPAPTSATVASAAAAVARPPVTDAVPPPDPPTAADSPEPIAVTVPHGATLVGLMRSLYGKQPRSARSDHLLADILRLNPHVKDANRIFAGDSLRLPPPPADGGAREQP